MWVPGSSERIAFPRLCLGCGIISDPAVLKEYKPFLSITKDLRKYSIQPAVYLCGMCREKADGQIELARAAIRNSPPNKMLSGFIIAVLLSFILAANFFYLSLIAFILISIILAIPVAYLLIDLPARRKLGKWIEKEWFKPYGRFMKYEGDQFGFSSLIFLDRFRKTNQGTRAEGSSTIFFRSTILSYELGSLNNSPYFGLRDGTAVLVPGKRESIEVYVFATISMLSFSFALVLASTFNPSYAPLLITVPILLGIIGLVANVVAIRKKSDTAKVPSEKKRTPKPKRESVPCLYCGFEKNSIKADTCRKCEKPLKGDRWKSCDKCGYYFNEPDATHCICGELL